MEYAGLAPAFRVLVPIRSDTLFDYISTPQASEFTSRNVSVGVINFRCNDRHMQVTGSMKCLSCSVRMALYLLCG